MINDLSSLNLDTRIRLYSEAKELSKAEYGCKKIARLFREKYNVTISHSTIYRWVKDVHTPYGRYTQYHVIPELAYVIGAWLGDGTLSRGRKYEYCVKLIVRDFDFAYAWGAALAKCVGRSTPYKPYWCEKLRR